MARFTDPLSQVRVARPCPADWDSMIGDERVRFCGQCELNVYNLSAMTRTQAENLIAGTERRLCIRYYRRRDGSIITQDCPVGLRALKQRISRVRRAVLGALLGFFTGAAGTVAVKRAETSPTVGEMRVPEVVQQPHELMGTFEVYPSSHTPSTGRKTPLKRRRGRSG